MSRQLAKIKVSFDLIEDFLRRDSNLPPDFTMIGCDKAAFQDGSVAFYFQSPRIRDLQEVEEPPEFSMELTGNRKD